MIHGIGGDAQLQGRGLEDVMNELGNFMRDGVPVAFHAPFDAGILRRHGLALRARWLDLAALAPGRGRKDSTLDHTAQLLLIILNEAQRQRLETVEALLKTERAGRWLAHH